ncbi:MAG: hypothetical protein JXA30_17995 [Deltaproteobacteria bacterium]|nr:hypothetical protein [Deltaproteobacteria bacterium]
MSYWYFGLLPFLFIATAGCAVYDKEKLTSQPSEAGEGEGKGDAANGLPDASYRDGYGNDSTNDSSGRDSTDTDSTVPFDASGCIANPDGNALCPLICPEVCDGIDNDCDGETDELSEACDLPNASTACEQDQCVIVQCDTGYGNCDGDVANGCETPLDTLKDCGECDRSCDGLSCAGGVCSELSCGPGLGDCNEDPDDGCETSLATLTDCGFCGHQCAIINASARCEDGRCEFVDCRSGFGDCDDDLSNGCETPLNTLTDCGECGNTCDASNGEASCAGGRCSTTSCDEGYADCNGDSSDGCETSLRSLEHCGSCDDEAKCGPLENATATCESGTCEIDECDEGYDDCDDEPLNGCETALNTNQNCGECRKPCGFPNAVTSCETGVCEVSPCNEGYRDCNGLEIDGCEADLNSVETCGSCTNDCTDLPNVTEAQCSGGYCSVETCDSGYGDCNNDPGCETPLNTVDNCSECGDSCPDEGGAAFCDEGECGINCDLSGTYALKVTVSVTWPDRDLTESGSGTYYSWSKLQATHSGDDVTGTLIECGKNAPAVASSVLPENYKINYLNAIFDHSPSYLPGASISASLNGDSPGATFSMNRTALWMGTTMSDPINDSWPSSASGLTQNDMDGDGKPGVSAVYLNSGSYDYPPTRDWIPLNEADSVYLAARVVFSLNGTLTSCTQSSGSASVTQTNTHIFGCNYAGSSQDCDASAGSFLDNNQGVFQPGNATYTLVKIDDEATCADVRAALP